MLRCCLISLGDLVEFVLFILNIFVLALYRCLLEYLDTYTSRKLAQRFNKLLDKLLKCRHAEVLSPELYYTFIMCNY